MAGNKYFAAMREKEMDESERRATAGQLERQDKAIEGAVDSRGRKIIERSSRLLSHRAIDNADKWILALKLDLGKYRWWAEVKKRVAEVPSSTMHPALKITEILVKIFGLLGDMREESENVPQSLAALARTCRTFKEPALDVLWSELQDLSPIARCIPDASASYMQDYYNYRNYKFIRMLDQTECDTLRSYARRIRSIQLFSRLDWLNSYNTYPSSSPIDISLFSNLQHTSLDLADELCLPGSLYFPSLVSLTVSRTTFPSATATGYTDELPDMCPNLRRLCITIRSPRTQDYEYISGCVCRWSNLQHVDCPDIALDADALAHLSRLSLLTRLSFLPREGLMKQIGHSGSPIFFPNLCYFEMSDCQSLTTASWFLSRIRLPLLTHLVVRVKTCPPGSIGPFLEIIPTTCGQYRSLIYLELGQHVSLCFPENALYQKSALTFDDVQSCTAFSNLRYVNFCVDWDVDLVDGELLALASAWPHLEYFKINPDWGWRPDMKGARDAGITPDGLFQLLEMCPSLKEIGLAIDARGYTETPPRLREGHGGRMLDTLDVSDSFIQEENVAAMAAFVANLSTHCSGLEFCRREHRVTRGEAGPDWWKMVYDRAEEIVSQRSFGEEAGSLTLVVM